MSDEREQLLRFQNALRSEAHHVRRWPQLTAQQVFNALSESDASGAAALEPQFATRTTKGSWLRRVPRKSTARPRLTLDEDVEQAELQSGLDRLITLHPLGWRLISPATGANLVERDDIFRKLGLGSAQHLAIARDAGRFVVLHSASGRGEISVWEPTGELVSRWSLQPDSPGIASPNSTQGLLNFPGLLALSRDGRILAIVSDNGEMVVRVRVWDAVAGALLGERSVASVRDIVQCDQDGIGVFDRMDWHQGLLPLAVGFGADEDVVFAALPGSIVLWDWRRDAVVYERRFNLHRLKRVFGPSVARSAMSAGGNLVGFVTSDGRLHAFHPSNPERVWSLDLRRKPNALAASPKGHMLATVDEQGHGDLFDLAPLRHAGAFQAAVGSSLSSASIGFSTDGDLLLTTVDGGLSVFDVKRILTTKSATAEEESAFGKALAVSPPLEAVTARYGHLFLVDLASRRSIWSTAASQVAPVVKAVCLAGGEIACATADGTLLVLAGLATNPIAQRTFARGAMTCLAASPDSEMIAAGTENGYCMLWRWRSDTVIDPVPMVPGRVTALAFSTDTRLTVAFESETFESLVFDLATQHVEGSLEGHTGVVTCAAATTRFIATGGWDGTVRVWDARTLDHAGSPMPHGAGVELVGFDDSGNFILTVDRIHVCRIWRAGTGELIALYPSDAPVEAAAMDHGRVVLVGEEAQAVTLLFVGPH